MTVVAAMLPMTRSPPARVLSVQLWFLWLIAQTMSVMMVFPTTVMVARPLRTSIGIFVHLLRYGLQCCSRFRNIMSKWHDARLISRRRPVALRHMRIVMFSFSALLPMQFALLDGRAASDGLQRDRKPVETLASR